MMNMGKEVFPVHGRVRESLPIQDWPIEEICVPVIHCMLRRSKKKARQDRYYSCIADLRNHKIKHKGIEGIRWEAKYSP